VHIGEVYTFCSTVFLTKSVASVEKWFSGCAISVLLSCFACASDYRIRQTEDVSDYIHVDTTTDYSLSAVQWLNDYFGDILCFCFNFAGK